MNALKAARKRLRQDRRVPVGASGPPRRAPFEILSGAACEFRRVTGAHQSSRPAGGRPGRNSLGPFRSCSKTGATPGFRTSGRPPAPLARPAPSVASRPCIEFFKSLYSCRRNSLLINNGLQVFRPRFQIPGHLAVTEQIGQRIMLHRVLAMLQGNWLESGCVSLISRTSSRAKRHQYGGLRRHRQRPELQDGRFDCPCRRRETGRLTAPSARPLRALSVRFPAAHPFPAAGQRPGFRAGSRVGRSMILRCFLAASPRFPLLPHHTPTEPRGRGPHVLGRQPIPPASTRRVARWKALSPSGWRAYHRHDVAIAGSHRSSSPSLAQQARSFPAVESFMLRKYRCDGRGFLPALARPLIFLLLSGGRSGT